MNDARAAVGLIVMLLGVALLIGIAVVDLPGLRPQRRTAARIAARLLRRGLRRHPRRGLAFARPQ